MNNKKNIFLEEQVESISDDVHYLSNLRSGYCNFLTTLIFVYAPFLFALQIVFGWSTALYSATSLSFCIIISLLLLKRSTVHDFEKSYVNITLFLFIFLFSFFLSNASSQFLSLRFDVVEMWLQLVMAIIPVLLFFSCRSFAATRSVYSGINIGLYILTFIALLSIGLEVSNLYHVEKYSTRNFGFLGDGVGWILTFVAILFFSEKRPVSLAICLVFLTFTQSLGAGIIFLIGATLMILFGGNRFRKKTLLPSLIVCMIILSSVLLSVNYFDVYIERFSQINFLLNDRIETTKLSVDLFDNSPLYGSGYNSQQYFFPEKVFIEPGLVAHSTPTSTMGKVLSDTGLIGFIPYIFFLLYLSKICFKFLKRQSFTKEDNLYRGLSAWLISFLWFNHFAAWLLPGSYHTPLVFAAAGIVMGAEHRIKYHSSL